MMAIRKLFISPGDTVEILIIKPECEKTLKCFEYERELHMAGKISFHILGINKISFPSGLVPDIGVENNNGEITSWL